MKSQKFGTVLVALLLPMCASALEICGQDLLINSVGNFSTGSGGPYIGDVTINAGGKNYEWRMRYGLDAHLLDQAMSLAISAKAAGRKVDIYCTVADQTYNARYIVMK